MDDHFDFVEAVFTPEVPRLFSRLEKRTGRKIEDHDSFRKACEMYAVFYLHQKVMDGGPTPKQVLKSWERMARHLGAFIAEFDRLGDSLGYNLFMRRHLEFDVDENGRSYHVGELIKSVRENYARRYRNVLASLDEARAEADRCQQGGRPKALALDRLIPFLGEEYQKAIGLDWTATGEVEDGGPFTAFIRDFLAIIDPVEKKDPHKLERSALYKTIGNIRCEEKALKARKAGAVSDDQEDPARGKGV